MITTTLNLIIASATSADAMSTFNSTDFSTFHNMGDVIFYLISIVGGFLAHLIIRIFKKKNPDLFAKLKKGNSNDNSI